MAKKQRIGIRCHNPYVPNEIWELFKKELRKILVVAFPKQKLSVTEFYWQGFSVENEYIRRAPKDEKNVDSSKVWTILQFVSGEFGMQINFVYQKEPVFRALREDDLFERNSSSYSLINIRTWDVNELDEFLETYSTVKLKEKYTSLM